MFKCDKKKSLLFQYIVTQFYSTDSYIIYYKSYYALELWYDLQCSIDLQQFQSTSSTKCDKLVTCNLYLDQWSNCPCITNIVNIIYVSDTID